MNMTISQNGIDLTKSFEGIRLTAYRDVAGIFTVGYGHTGPEVHAGMTITGLEAISLLAADMHAAIAVVNRLVRVTVTQNQFDALVDFVYNAGQGAFALSTLLRELNMGDYAGAAAQFELWDHAGGNVVPGLLARRLAERDLFLKIGAV